MVYLCVHECICVGRVKDKRSTLSLVGRVMWRKNTGDLARLVTLHIIHMCVCTCYKQSCIALHVCVECVTYCTSYMCMRLKKLYKATQFHIGTTYQSTNLPMLHVLLYVGRFVGLHLYILSVCNYMSMKPMCTVVYMCIQ